MTKTATWRVIGDHHAGKLIGYYLDGIKQCTFVGRFDGINKFELTYQGREYYGTVPKERVIYLADLERKRDNT
jgi:hypothetical protein